MISSRSPAEVLAQSAAGHPGQTPPGLLDEAPALAVSFEGLPVAVEPEPVALDGEPHRRERDVESQQRSAGSPDRERSRGGLEPPVARGVPGVTFEGGIRTVRLALLHDVAEDPGAGSVVQAVHDVDQLGGADEPSLLGIGDQVVGVLPAGASREVAKRAGHAGRSKSLHLDDVTRAQRSGAVHDDAIARLGAPIHRHHQVHRVRRLRTQAVEMGGGPVAAHGPVAEQFEVRRRHRVVGRLDPGEQPHPPRDAMPSLPRGARPQGCRRDANLDGHGRRDHAVAFSRELEERSPEVHARTMARPDPLPGGGSRGCGCRSSAGPWRRGADQPTLPSSGSRSSAGSRR